MRQVNFKSVVVICMAVLCSVDVLAQQLEEIVVTAQRREQSVQDVPVSLEVFGGDEVSRQGFDNLSELSMFAPGLIVRDRGEEQGLIMRGAGTQSKNLAIEQGVPTFIDGIHFGRASQVKNQFLDIERIEVLKGPQPVYFGQNAGAGALNITTRKPGPEWTGHMSGEIGNFGSREVEAAVGGPLTQTLGIRLAGRYDIMTGYLTDYFSGQKFPQREGMVGRVTLQWTPNDRFQATLKAEVADNDIGARPTALVRDGFPLDMAQGESVLVSGIETISDIPPYDAPVGAFTNVGLGQGISPVLSPTLFGDRIIGGNGPLRQNGVLDISRCTSLAAEGIPLYDKFENCKFADDAEAKPWHAVMDLGYELGNGILVNSKTGFSHHTYSNAALNTGGPIVTNPRSRDEEFDQWSTELRLTSPTGGTISWMAGLYYQNNDHDMQNTQLNTDGNRQIRGSITAVDSEWTSAFATVTYNFFDDKASIDLGARYTHVKKFGKGRNTAAEWIIEHPVTGEPYVMPLGRWAIPNQGDLNAGYDVVALSGGDPFGFNGAAIIGRTPVRNERSQLDPSHNPGGPTLNAFASQAESYSENNLDPQVVLRYRPHEDLSLYAKWVESVKSGGYDGGVVEITRFAEDWSFGPESYESYEIGARGMFLGGRVRMDLSAYLMKIIGQQVSNIDPILRRNVTRNVAESETKGVELLTSWAASDRLTMNATLSLMDGKIVDFPNSVCVTNEVLAGLCSGPQGNLIDRSGQEARNAPDWQVTGLVNYELPTFLQGYRSNFTGLFMASDSYTDNRNFSDVVSYAPSEDINLSLEVGDIEEDWSVTFWARNLLEVRPTYFTERALAGDGILSASDGAQLGNDAFTTYGMTFRYNFFK